MSLSIPKRLKLRQNLNLLTTTGYKPPPPPATTFKLGLNLSGMELQYPVITSLTEIQYYANRGFTNFRLPIGWSLANPTYGTTGIQPVAYGPLDTTSSYLSYPPLGSNVLVNSQAIASPPWVAGAGGSPTFANNVAAAPDGTMTASSMTDAASSGIYSFEQGFSINTATGAASIYVQAAAQPWAYIQVNATQATGFNAGVVFFDLSGAGSVGGNLPLAGINPILSGAISQVAGAPGWYRISAIMIGSGFVGANVYYGSTAQDNNRTYSGSGTVAAYFWGAQVNANSTLLPYQATIGGYLGALDFILANITSVGAKALIDCHTFGGGPGGFVGSPQLPISAFANLWQQISAHYKGNPGVRGYDLMNEWTNGFSSTTVFNAAQAAIYAIRGNGDTTPIYVEGTNYSGVWNWITGEGQPYNNANLYKLVDPAKNLIFSGHGYLNNNSSGSTFSYAYEEAKPGAAPPGYPTSATIGITREDGFIPWAMQYNVAMHHGEIAGSNDGIYVGGNDNYSAWNTALENTINLIQSNNYEVDIWGAGAGFSPYYPAYPGPSSTSNPFASDFSSAGLQSTVMVLLEQYTGYAGPQPRAYRIDLPATVSPPTVSSPPTISYSVATASDLPSGATQGQYGFAEDTTDMWYYTSGAWVNAENPIVTPQVYGTSGAATGNFTIRYNGVIPPGGVTVTPSDYLLDGVTSAGGTFTPSSVTLPAGNNAIGYFTYTPSQEATILISATNSSDWINPPALGLSSQNDAYRSAGIATPTNIYGMYLRYTPYIGPALTLQRSTDDAQMTFYFNNLGNLPRETIQTWASSNLIPIVSVYDQSPSGNTLTFTGTLPNLNLNNAAGYPEIDCASGVTGIFNTPINNQTALSIITRMNQSSSTGGGLFRMDQFTGPIIWFSNEFQIYNTGYVGDINVGGSGPVAAVTFGLISNAYHEYAVTYASGVTNGLKSYLDGTANQETTAAYILNAAFGSEQVNFAYFRFGSQFFVGSLTSLEFETGQTLTPTQVVAINSADETYYSTPLPDHLPTVPPGIYFTVADQPIYPALYTSYPFQTVVIADTNSGTPTDSVTITLTGPGTLSGTGISGSGPYTIASASAASVTATLQAAAFTTANSIGATTTFTIAVTSSAGSNSSNSNTSTVVKTYVSETPFSAPSGTFTPVNKFGVNLAGGENAGAGPVAQLPQNFELQYFASKGFGLIRLPVSMNLMQPTNFQPLNTTFLDAVQSVINYAFTQNLYVVIDPHNYGNTWDTAADANVPIYPNTLTQNFFVDWWSRVATRFVNYPNVIFGLMNEPSTPATASQWQQAAAAAITAIRAAGTTQLITIPGVGYTNAGGWISNGNGTAWAGFAGDPENNFVFEAHQYLDAGNSGGSPVATQNGATVLASMTAWLVTNSFQAVLFEFGLAPDPWYPLNNSNLINNYDPSHGITLTTNSVTENSAMLTYMQSNSGQWVGWAEWAGGIEFSAPPQSGGYCFNPEPARPYPTPIVDQPQIAVLVSYL